MMWYNYPVGVPFGNPNYDVGLGGSHDMTILAPPNYPVTALLPGNVVDVSSPSWGRQVGIQLSVPYNSKKYMAYLHLSATNVQMGQFVRPGDIIGWVGGANMQAQYAGTTNPTGINFLNGYNMSSQVQVGVALMNGPEYGSGAGWEVFPPIDMSLNPTQILLDARSMPGVDYPGAINMMVPKFYSWSTMKPLVIVEHCTGGDMTIEAVHDTFLRTERSAHFAVGRDGRVAQFVPLSRGAGGNCCPDSSHDSFWNNYIPTYPNLDFCTISIEHCNDAEQSLTMTPAQTDASNKLNLWLCNKYGIDSSHVKGHDSIDATNCPGKVFYDTYWSGMISYIEDGGVMPINLNQRKSFEIEYASEVASVSLIDDFANQAWQDYQLGNFHGPATSAIYDNNDWSGVDVIAVNCHTGTYHRSVDGKITFYHYK